MEAVGRLAGGVAHDFNNLLTIIRGNSDLLIDRDGADAFHKRCVEQIQKASGRAVAMTRQLLAFSRMQVLQPRVLDLNAVVAEMGKMLPRLIGEHIEHVFVPEPKLKLVTADPGQIEQVLMNLAVNCARRDAWWRNAYGADRERRDDAGGQRATWVHAARIVRAAFRERYRYRNGRTDQNSYFRAVLHYQRGRQGYGAGPGDRLRDCEAERRIHLGGKRAGKRAQRSKFICRWRLVPHPRQRRKPSKRRCGAEARRFWWWKTKPGCASWQANS